MIIIIIITIIIIFGFVLCGEIVCLCYFIYQTMLSIPVISVFGIRQTSISISRPPFPLSSISVFNVQFSRQSLTANN